MLNKVYIKFLFNFHEYIMIFSLFVLKNSCFAENSIKELIWNGLLDLGLTTLDQLVDQLLCMKLESKMKRLGHIGLIDIPS